MTAPAVQYAKTEDGYSIAYTVKGDGPPLMVLPFGFSHAQAVWTSSSATPLLQTLAERFRVVYFDGRGQGLSQRGLPPHTSIQSLLEDVRCVVEKAGFPRQVLVADNSMAHLAVHYALENPARVKALVLMHCPVSLVAQISWVSTAVSQNWEFYLSSQTGLAVPTQGADLSLARARVEGLKARTTREDFLQKCAVFAASDLSDILPRIATPTLVLHIPSQGWVSQEESAATAALLPNGRLAVVSGTTFFGDAAEIVGTIERFLAESDVERPPVFDVKSVLSSREIEVLKLVAAGKSNQLIADELVISLNTVNRHVSNIYAKTGVANRAEAVSYAHRSGLAD